MGIFTKSKSDSLVDAVIFRSGKYKNLRDFKGGQHVVTAKEILFKSNRLSNSDASRIVSKASKELGLDSRNPRMGFNL